MNARTLPYDRNAEAIITEAKEEILRDLAARVAEIEAEEHDEVREAAFQRFMENSDFPRREDRYTAPCGCLRTLDSVSDDGETTYREWTWTNALCRGRK